MRRVLAVVVVLLLVVAGLWWFLWRDEEPLPKQPLVEQFFDDLGSLDATDQREALSLTRPGSPARAYVTYQLALTRARLDDKVKTTPSEAVQRPEGWDLCQPTPDGSRICNAFSRIRADDEAVRSFRIDGDDIRDNLAFGTGRRLKAGAAGSVELVASYLQPSTQGLWIVFRVHTRGVAVDLQLHKARFTAREGALLVTAATQTKRVPPRTDFTAAVEVPGGKLGGNLKLHLRTRSGVHDVSLPSR